MRCERMPKRDSGLLVPVKPNTVHQSSTKVHWRITKAATACLVGTEYRKVDFRLEVTGDDMTGLLADVVELRNTVGLQQDESSGRLNKLAKTVVTTCWKEPKSYHGCQVFAEDCLEDKTRPNCKEMFENKSKDLGVYNLIKDMSRQPITTIL